MTQVWHTVKVPSQCTDVAWAKLWPRISHAVALRMDLCGTNWPASVWPTGMPWPSLTSVSFRAVQWLTPAILESLWVQAPRLTSIDMHCAREVDVLAVRALCAANLHVHTLDLGQQGWSWSPLLELPTAPALYTLQHLSLAFCVALTDEALGWFVLHCRALESVDLSSCVRITSDGVAGLARRCPALARLILVRCDALIDNVFLDALATHATRLHTLSLPHRCSSLSTLHVICRMPALRAVSFAIGTQAHTGAMSNMHMLTDLARLNVPRACAQVNASLPISSTWSPSSNYSCVAQNCLSLSRFARLYTRNLT
jgi:hypothetical protein